VLLIVTMRKLVLIILVLLRRR